MTSGPMSGAKERGKDMQSTFSASLGKSHARKFIFGGVLVAALAATGFTQAPSTPTASSSVVSTNIKDVSNLKKEKQQQIEYFLVNEGLKKVNILFLTTVDDIGRWKEALERYFSEKSSNTISITVSSPKGGEEGLNNEKLLYYNVTLEKAAKQAVENTAVQSTAPAASNPAEVAVPPAPVTANTKEKKSEVTAETVSMAGIKPEVKAEQVKTEPIIKEAKKEEPKIAGAEEKKEPKPSTAASTQILAPTPIPIPFGMQRVHIGQTVVENKCAIDLKSLSVPYGDVPAKASLKILEGFTEQEFDIELAGSETKEIRAGSKAITVISSNVIAGLTPLDSYVDLRIIVRDVKAEEKKPEMRSEEKKEEKPAEKKEEVAAKVLEVKAPEVKVLEVKAPVVKELSPDEMIRYDACISKFEIMYGRTSYNTFKDIAEFMKKNAKQRPDILKTIDDVENYFKAQASTIYKGPSEVETLKQMIEMTVGPIQ